MRNKLQVLKLFHNEVLDYKTCLEKSDIDFSSIEHKSKMIAYMEVLNYKEFNVKYKFWDVDKANRYLNDMNNVLDDLVDYKLVKYTDENGIEHKYIECDFDDFFVELSEEDSLLIDLNAYDGEIKKDLALIINYFYREDC